MECPSKLFPFLARDGGGVHIYRSDISDSYVIAKSSKDAKF
jgi:hypothetical protein